MKVSHEAIAYLQLDLEMRLTFFLEILLKLHLIIKSLSHVHFKCMHGWHGDTVLLPHSKNQQVCILH